MSKLKFTQFEIYFELELKNLVFKQYFPMFNRKPEKSDWISE